MFEINQSQANFLREVYYSENDNVELDDIVSRINISEEDLQELKANGWIQQVSYGMLGYIVPKPILKQLGIM